MQTVIPIPYKEVSDIVFLNGLVLNVLQNGEDCFLQYKIENVKFIKFLCHYHNIHTVTKSIVECFDDDLYCFNYILEYFFWDEKFYFVDETNCYYETNFYEFVKTMFFKKFDTGEFIYD